MATDVAKHEPTDPCRRSVAIAVIIAVSALVPMAGNLGLALFLDRARRLLSSPRAMHRMNVSSGVLLIGVGLVIPFL